MHGNPARKPVDVFFKLAFGRTRLNDWKEKENTTGSPFNLNLYESREFDNLMERSSSRASGDVIIVIPDSCNSPWKNGMSTFLFLDNI
jgi:hypothetical protein